MKQAAQLGVLTAASIAIAFLSQWYVLVQVGPGAETDALFAGMAIPQFVMAVITGSLMHVLVPLLSGQNEDVRRQDAWGFLVLIGGMFGLFAVLLYVTAPWWVPLTVPGFDDTGRALTVELTRVQLITMVFASINGVQWATCHARQQFVWAEFTPILANVTALLLLVWALPRFGVIAAAWIGVLRAAMHTLLLAPGMGFPVRPDLKSAATQEAWRRVKPLLLGTAYYKTDPVVDRCLLSMAGSGSLSLFYFAQQIHSAASQVVNRALVSPKVPALSRLHKSGDSKGFQQVYRTKMLQVGTIGLSGLLVLAVFGQELLGLLVQTGKVSVTHAQELWWIMLWLFGTFIGGTMGQVSSSSFYALGDTSTPTRLGIRIYTLYIPIKIALFYYVGVMGLALATSMFFVTNLYLQNHLLKVRHFQPGH